MAAAGGAWPAGRGPEARCAAYLVDETASTLMTLHEDAGQLAALQTISTLPAGYTGQNTGAEVVVDGGFVWTSNRGADDLATFTVGADARVAVVGHTVTAYAIDRSTGLPAAIGSPVSVQAPSFVGIAALP